ncbi:protein far1-related sequence 11 [Gigaspora margarita]|uniref:Restriction of telomere capping protein 4 n=1 Tax=Gigaspora margarita TaxID=4874 RepID=A0A8H3XH55_GIGMA|nr:protein far1-related sequence 11 [Gigaspora margarita]
MALCLVIKNNKLSDLCYRINVVLTESPGCYGSKKLAVILTALTDMFVKTKILTTNLCAPQSFSQYLTQVLAPETMIRLIVENFNNIFLEDAKEIIIDSIEFEQYIYDDSD